MTTTQIASIEQSLTPLAQAMGDASFQKSDEVSDLQLLQVQMEAQQLAAKAFEIEDMARRMAGDPDLRDEADHAKMQANQMRGMVEQVNLELNSAPTDRQTGKKKLSANRVAGMIGALEKGIDIAEQEKKSLRESISDPAAHGGSSHKAEPKMAVEPSIVSKTISKICHLPSKSAAQAMGRAAVQPAGGLSGLFSRAHAFGAAAVAQTSDFISRGWKAASDTAQTAWEAVSQFSPMEALSDAADSAVQTVKTVTNKMAAGAVAAKEYVVVAVEIHITKPAVALGKSVMTTARETKAAIANAVSNGVEKTKTAVADAGHWVSNKFSEKKRWVTSLFEDEKPAAKPVPKLAVAQAKAATPANDNMMKALKQAAAALTLPMALNGQAVADMLHFSTPNLPNLNTALAHLPSFY